MDAGEGDEWDGVVVEVVEGIVTVGVGGVDEGEGVALGREHCCCRWLFAGVSSLGDGGFSGVMEWSRSGRPRWWGVRLWVGSWVRVFGQRRVPCSSGLPGVETFSIEIEKEKEEEKGRCVVEVDCPFWGVGLFKRARRAVREWLKQ